MQNGEGNRQSSQTNARISGIGLQELSRLLASASSSFGRTRLMQARAAEEDDNDPDYIDSDDDDDDQDGPYYRGHRKPRLWFKPHTEPQEAGTRLLMGGEFGRVGDRIGSRRGNVNIAKVMRDRASQARPSIYKEDMANVSDLSISL